MKILLVRPPVKCIEGVFRPTVDIPLGILYIASILENIDINVEIYDALVNGEEDSKQVPKVKGHFGASWKTIEEKIRNAKPNIVGITNQFTAQIANAIKVAEIIKEVDKKILTIIGGNHASVSPQSFFDETNSIDIVCVGEGEYTLPKVIEYLKKEKNLSEIEGIAYRENNKVVINKKREPLIDLDNLPYPAYHLIDMEKYFNLIKRGYHSRAIYDYPGSERSVSMITSRGCPFNCIFCSIHLHMGKKWRFHSANYVLNHLEFLVTEYGVKNFHFEDDNLTLNLERFEAIIDGIIDRGLKITWDTPNGVRADLLTKELIIKSKLSGCTYLYIGVESGVPEITNKIIRKQLDLNKVINVAKWCQEIGLDIGAFFVIGFPGEKKEDMLGTVDFALMLQQKFGVNSTLYIANPLVGTELYKTCVNHGFLTKKLTPEELARGIDTTGLIQTDDFTPEDISKLRRMFFRKNKRSLLYNFTFFIMKNPKALLRLLSILLKTRPNQLKVTLVRYLFLRNCLLRKKFP